MSLAKFQVLSKIGEGAYSVVYKVRRLSDNTEYALKKVKMGGLSSKEKENALNEIRILASFQYLCVSHFKIDIPILFHIKKLFLKIAQLLYALLWNMLMVEICTQK